MADNTIFLRVGERDKIPLRLFIDTLRNFLGILQDFDSSISEDRRGSSVWEVVSLQQNSPPIVGVSPTVRLGKFDNSNAVEGHILESTLEITSRGERSRLMSDAALTKLEKLAAKTEQYGSNSIFLNANGRPKRESVITPETLKNVQQFTSPKYSSYGSITGKLEAITVHKSNEFRVWDETTGRPVRCKFDLSQDGLVRDLLRTRVTVSGEILSNSSGIPISLHLDGLNKVEARDLPSIDDMRGLIKDFTNGLSLKDYLMEISDE